MDLMREPYNFAAAHYAMDMIPERRRIMQLGDQERAGERFMSDNRVYEELESAFTDLQFGSDPERYVDLTLHNCASLDYYYDMKHEMDSESPIWEGDDEE